MTAQVTSEPMDTLLYRPSGTGLLPSCPISAMSSAWHVQPLSFGTQSQMLPQHTSSPPDRTAHACVAWTSIDVKVPPGALSDSSLLAPQHATVPSRRMPQFSCPPAEIALNFPGGSSASSPGVYPPQRTVESCSSRHVW